jgi:hypothetical protein
MSPIIEQEIKIDRGRGSVDFKIRKNSGAYRGPKIDLDSPKTHAPALSFGTGSVLSTTEFEEEAFSPKKLINFSKMQKL